jgi:hypothetical protein
LGHHRCRRCAGWFRSRPRGANKSGADVQATASSPSSTSRAIHQRRGGERRGAVRRASI